MFPSLFFVCPTFNSAGMSASLLQREFHFATKTLKRASTLLSVSFFQLLLRYSRSLQPQNQCVPPINVLQLHPSTSPGNRFTEQGVGAFAQGHLGPRPSWDLNQQLGVTRWIAFEPPAASKPSKWCNQTSDLSTESNCLHITDSVIFSFMYDEKYSETSQSEAAVMWTGLIPISRHPFPGEGKLEQPREAGGYGGRLLLIHATLTYTNKRGNRRDDSRGEHSCLLKTDREEASLTSVEQRKTATRTHSCAERSNNVFFCGLLGACCACSGRLSSLKKSV